MKSLIGICALLLTFGFGCDPSTSAPSPQPEGKRAVASPSLVAANTAARAEEPSDWSPPLFDGSIYDLDVKLTDETGKKVSLDVFRGHPVLITMFYAGCPNACPLLTSDLKRIDQKLDPKAREKLRVLMVSFDSVHDTPQVLENHERVHRLDAARWKLANADDATARDIAGVLGIKYRKLDSGQYFHTSAILLLDETGRPKVRIEGLGKNPEPILAALQ